MPPRPGSRLPREPPASKALPLPGAECGEKAADGATGWRAYLAVDDEVVFYCQRCAVREFGQRHTRSLSDDLRPDWLIEDPD